VDPWAGSYHVERLTHELMHKAWELIQEVEELGGMARAIERGLPKLRIEEAATRKQARIDSGKDVIVGVNRYQLDQETEMDILAVDNSAVREGQLARLTKVKEERNAEAVESALERLQNIAAGAEGNLLEAAVDAARVRATLGEISSALEKEFGRFKADTRSVTGVYLKENMADEDVKEARRLSDEFADEDGRRARILVAKMGQDGHDRGAKVIATSFADLGFDVDIGPLFQTPSEVAKQAMENDVHILGISSLAGGHRTLVPQVIEELEKHGCAHVMVIVGGVVPKQDYEHLYESGVSFVFGPGTKIPKAAIEILNSLRQGRG